MNVIRGLQKVNLPKAYQAIKIVPTFIYMSSKRADISHPIQTVIKLHRNIALNLQDEFIYLFSSQVIFLILIAVTAKTRRRKS